jgi:hypothetical protein
MTYLIVIAFVVFLIGWIFFGGGFWLFWAVLLVGCVLFALFIVGFLLLDKYRSRRKPILK